jgi:SAM-dependent methyltransferase
LKRFLLRTGLYGPVWELRGRLRGLDPRTLLANRRYLARHPPDHPLPPPRLIYEVVNHYRIDAFLAGGRERADAIVSALESTGFSPGTCRRALDFGCGCGRVIRHLADRIPAEWHGSDLNPRLVAWCRDNLSFATFTTNELAPPLPFEDSFFDLIYAISVFTHLDEGFQNRWLAELHRVLAPGGAALVTTHGDAWRDGLDPAERTAYDAGQIVVRSSQAPGSNLCETYHPPAYFRRVTEALFDEVYHLPQGDAEHRAQDIWILRTTTPPLTVESQRSKV